MLLKASHFKPGREWVLHISLLTLRAVKLEGGRVGSSFCFLGVDYPVTVSIPYGNNGLGSPFTLGVVNLGCPTGPTYPERLPEQKPEGGDDGSRWVSKPVQE